VTDELDRLRVSEQLYRRTLENVSDAVFLSDDEGTFRYVCPNCNVIFGYAPGELEPRGLRGLFRTPEVVDLDRLRQECEIRNIPATIDRSDGSMRSCSSPAARRCPTGATSSSS
jgi:PAS domain S-box-containing protein